MGTSSLSDAASRGDLTAIRKLLSEGADPNELGRSGRTPLFDAAEKGHEDAARLLLEAGADPNRADDDHRTPLGQAIWIGNTKVIRLLLDAGASVEGYGHGATTPLMIAASNGRRASVEWLLEAGADVSARDPNGSTVLHFAAGQGKTALVELFLNKGADPNAVNVQGFTALHGAIQRAKMATVRLLLDRGADVNATSKIGVTPLLLAVQHGRAKLVQAMLDAGADPNIPYQENDAFQPHLTKGATCLHIVAHHGKLEIVKALIQAGAAPNLRNDRGQTPLDVAEAQGFADVIDYLAPLTQVSPDDAKDAKALGPRLVRSALGGKTEDVKALLAQGADPNSRDPQPIEQGRTALIAACQNGHVGCARALIEAGADVEMSTLENAWLGQSQTPLIAASVEGHAETVRLLLNAGARADAKDSSGETALLLAAEAGHPEVVRLLLASGADPTYVPQSPESDANDENEERAQPRDAIARALDNDHESVFETFLEAGAKPSQSTMNIAARMGRASLVRRLLDLGLSASAADSNGETPLHAACLLQTTVLECDPLVNIVSDDSKRYLEIAAAWQLETVRLLLERGADPNALDAQGQTPLHPVSGLETHVIYRHAHNPDDAAKHTSNEIDTAPIVRMLLERGADPNVRDRDGKSPLMRAARVGRPYGQSFQGVIEALLDAGADVNAQDAQGQTALFSTYGADKAILRRLIEAGADLHIRDAEGRTPLLQVVEFAYDDVGILKVLIEGGADVNVRNRDGQSAIDLALDRQANKVAKLLKQAGAIVESRANRRLHEATAEGDLKKVRAALKKGADPQARVQGWNAFGMAISQGKREIVAAMIEAGADVNRVEMNLAVATPLQTAIESERMNVPTQNPPEIVSLLLKAGADPNALDRKGRSLLVYAAWMGHRALVDCLVAGGARWDADSIALEFFKVMDLAERAKAPEFQQAMDLVRSATNAKLEPIETRSGAYAVFVTAQQETDAAMRQEETANVARFSVEWNVLDKKVRDLSRDMRSRLAPLGATVIDLGRPIGCGPSGKFLVLLPTTDQFTALAACGPSPGGDYGEDGLALPDVVAWFRKLEADVPFTIWGAGRDFVEVEFLRPIAQDESIALAERIYAFCPDSVDQGAGTKAKLARQIRETKRVFFWWD